MSTFLLSLARFGFASSDSMVFPFVVKYPLLVCPPDSAWKEGFTLEIFSAVNPGSALYILPPQPIFMQPILFILEPHLGQSLQSHSPSLQSHFALEISKASSRCSSSSAFVKYPLSTGLGFIVRPPLLL